MLQFTFHKATLFYDQKIVKVIVICLKSFFLFGSPLVYDSKAFN